MWLYDLDSWRDPATALGEQHAQLRADITENLRALMHSDNVRVIAD